MTETYTQLRYHLVFSTKHRMPVITGELKSAIYDYIGGVPRGNGGILLAMGGMPDHVHLLAGWGASTSVAKMLKLLKGSSSRWVNKKPGEGSFWQEGYGAFTVSASQVPTVKSYIQNQERHHKKTSFRQELMTLLKKHEVDFDPKTFMD